MLPAAGRERTAGTPAALLYTPRRRQGPARERDARARAGVCLYCITAGTLPFDEPNLPVMFDKIARADFAPAPWWSPELAHLIQHILVPDPLQRRAPLSLSFPTPLPYAGAPHPPPPRARPPPAARALAPRPRAGHMRAAGGCASAAPASRPSARPSSYPAAERPLCQ